MLIIMTIGVLAGTVLGLRFKALILVPTIGLALTMVAFSGLVRGESVWRLIVTMTLVAAFLQLGYMAGIVLRFAFSAVRAGDHHSASMSTSPGGGPVRTTGSTFGISPPYRFDRQSRNSTTFWKVYDGPKKTRAT
jgi:hypothetical protein